ncbi:MAG: hypothetical protein KKB94_01750 [Proteobacteria bacterium]|nr:hypothetical protein [Pseudomonadota bacterium]
MCVALFAQYCSGCGAVLYPPQ